MNIYSVLDDSDTEEQKPKVVAADKKAKDTKPAAASAAPKKDAVKPVKATDAKKGESTQTNTAAPKSKTAGDKPKSAPAASDANESSGKDDNRGGKPRGKEYRERGGRGGRGGAEGAADGERRPKREFERHSGTGRGREVSKGGRGAFGFGNAAQDAQEAEKNPSNVEGVTAPVTEGDEVAVEPEEVAEPEPATFTMDEFMEKRNQARKALLEANTVKVRAVDTAALAGLSRKEDEGETTYMPVKAGKTEASKKDQRSTGKTAVLDVAFKFAAIQVDNDRDGRGGRGEGGRGRGEGRGRGGDGRGRGSGRGEGRGSSSRGASAGNKAYNPSDFPSL